MLISPAMAGHFVADDGNSGGGNTLLIILGVGLVLFLLYTVQKKWRRRRAEAQGAQLGNEREGERETSEP